MKLNITTIILMGLVTSGCATSSEVAKQNFKPDSSAIVFKIENDGKRCFVTNAVFVSKDTAKTYQASYTATHTFKSFTDPYDIVYVAPGNYKLMSLNCEVTLVNGQYQSTSTVPVRGASTVMKSFNVKAGQILYPGSIYVKKVGKKGTVYEGEFIDLADKVLPALTKDGLDGYFVKELAK